MKRQAGKFGQGKSSQSEYISGTLDELLPNAYAGYDDGFVEIPSKTAENPEESGGRTGSKRKKKKSRKQFSQNAQTKIESILSPRTFLLVGGTTILLVFYIYNVISINKLAGESEQLRKKIEEVKSLNTVLESRVQTAWRFEELSKVAGKELDLKMSTKLPVVLETE